MDKERLDEMIRKTKNAMSETEALIGQLDRVKREKNIPELHQLSPEQRKMVEEKVAEMEEEFGLNRLKEVINKVKKKSENVKKEPASEKNDISYMQNTSFKI